MVWDISPTLIQIGPIEIRYYGVIFATMLLGGYYLWRWQMMRGGVSEQDAENFILIGVIGVVVGSRMGHVLFYEPEVFFANPIEILKVWKGGLASHGATVGLMLSVLYFSRRYKVPLLVCSDRFSFAAALGAFAVRVGNFLNSEIVGRVTDLPWGIKFPRCYYDHNLPLDLVPTRHPSQIYEAFLGLSVLGVLLLIDRRYKEERPVGLLTSVFLLLYFSGRFFVEFFKEFQTLEAGASMLTMGQYLSLPFIIVGLIGLVLSIKNNVPTSSFRRAEPEEQTKVVKQNKSTGHNKKKKKKNKR